MTVEKAIKVLDMFLHKQCDLERTASAYDQNTVWSAVQMGRDALKERNHIVRCKDCKYYSKLITGVELCNLDGEPVRAVSEDDFCSKGVRGD